MSEGGVSVGTEDIDLHVQTPLIYSAPLSKVAGRPVFLKLENTQPSGSFKLRGRISRFYIGIETLDCHLD